MKLGGIGLLIRGRYGDQRWQHHRSTGGIGIAATRPMGAPEFDPDGTQTLRGLCTWLFQLSKARARQGLISKVLSCSETDESWELDPDFVKRRSIGTVLGRDELSGKKLVLELRVNQEERPAMRETWIRFPEGWKPCAEEDTLRVSGNGAEIRPHLEHSPWAVKNALSTLTAKSRSRMIMSDDSSQPTLRCPSSTHWVSFRLLNENGDGDSFAGLNFFIQDSQGQIHAGTLDATGFSGKLDIYCGPSILASQQIAILQMSGIKNY